MASVTLISPQQLCIEPELRARQLKTQTTYKKLLDISEHKERSGNTPKFSKLKNK
jgi:hypothetical protein